jgi:uncharacterized protein (TIGR04255 family)
VVEVRFDPKLDAKVVKSAGSKFLKHYPRANDHKEYQVEVDAQQQRAVFNTVAEGVRMANEDQTEVLLLLDDRFGRAVLAPYPGWDAFHETIVRDWQVWRPIAKPKKLARIAVRYINRLDLPLDGNGLVNLHDYLRFYAEFPENVTGPSLYTACQQVLKVGEDELMVSLNLVTTPPALVDHLSCVLDLDIYRETDVPQSDEDLWDLLARMRHHKNRLFEALTTDRAKALFDA